jgi:hypothetical protein
LTRRLEDTLVIDDVGQHDDLLVEKSEGWRFTRRTYTSGTEATP